MKRIIIIAVLALAATVAYAQPRAIGGRLGSGLEASYQHNAKGSENFHEINLGLAFIGLGVDAAYAYDFMIAQPEWTTKGKWGFYAGPAANVGYSAWGGLYYGGYGTVHLGVGGQIGLEYTFDFPLQISLDMRPTLGVRFGSGYVGFYSGGLLGFIPSLSLRYRFGWNK